MKILTIISLFILAPFVALADNTADNTSDQPGQVTVPLPVYTQMVNQLTKLPRPAPAAYAIGQSNVAITIAEADGRFTASVTVNLKIETFENEWTLVPILPPGTVLRRARVNGRSVQLVQGPDGLAWSTNKAGTVNMRLSYGVDARQSGHGFVLPLPAPVASATSLSLVFPGTGVDLAIVPAADMKRNERNGKTYYTAAIPATSSILVSWRSAIQRPYVIGHAEYSGKLTGDAVTWTAKFLVEKFDRQSLTLPLMPDSVILNDIRIDGAPATVLAEKGFFAAIVDGIGKHTVTVSFQVPVTTKGGPPQVKLRIPRIPVSRFDLVLPGKKLVKVTPGANVALSEVDDATLARVFIPMSDTVTFSWSDAIPENLRTPFRANATIYHSVNAEEGVLHGRAIIVYEISRGKTSQLELEIPANTEVNKITSPTGGLSDWSVTDIPGSARKKINVFLEVAVDGEYVLDISYERLLGGDQVVIVPLISAVKVHRQRGMVALLSGKELALKPETEEGVTRVGENQLPAFVRNQIKMTVAHTYKYSGLNPTLAVKPVVPERRQGKFDARVDTLISLGDVIMKGNATVEIDVKSGTIMALELRLPGDVNVLGVSGPSLRSQQIREVDGRQTINLAFTREMEGQFRINVAYERIMRLGGDDPEVATVTVINAEVEHGRIAIEALTAVEVRASASDQLSSLDINELPQQLVLKTTNPILMAYRYVHAKPPFKLTLTITRHKEIDVQVAAIERAVYNTLVTRDGLAVTTARLMVRNSRRQFLRLSLPAGSKVWSVFVDGKPEKPAFASNGEPAVLIKMINSAVGFPVDIVYATPIQTIDDIGSLSSHLPRPDMVVTHTRWNVFLPVGPSYQTPDSTMDLMVDGIHANPRRATRAMLSQAKDGQRVQTNQPLRINVPTRGILFAFEKLYANQSPKPAEFSIRYVSAGTGQVATGFSLFGVALLWLAIAAIASARLKLTRTNIIAALVSGLGFVVLAIGYLGVNPIPASALALVIAIAMALWWSLQRIQSWRYSRALAASE